MSIFKKGFLVLFAISSIVFYYILVYFLFLKNNQPEPLLLNERIGSFLYRYQDVQTTEVDYHIYCYYPSASIYPQIVPEYMLIKRVESFFDCIGWYGIKQIKEDVWKNHINKLNL